MLGKIKRDRNDKKDLSPGIDFLSGIYRDKTMADKFMYIPNDDTQITSSIDYNYVWTINLMSQPKKFYKSPQSC